MKILAIIILILVVFCIEVIAMPLSFFFYALRILEEGFIVEQLIQKL